MRAAFLSFSCTLLSSLDRHLQHCTISVLSSYLGKECYLLTGENTIDLIH